MRDGVQPVRLMSGRCVMGRLSILCQVTPCTQAGASVVCADFGCPGACLGPGAIILVVVMNMLVRASRAGHRVLFPQQDMHDTFAARQHGKLVGHHVMCPVVVS